MFAAAGVVAERHVIASGTIEVAGITANALMADINRAAPEDLDDPTPSMFSTTQRPGA